eukprot:326328-Amphidinium_carterae.1
MEALGNAHGRLGNRLLQYDREFAQGVFAGAEPSPATSLASSSALEALLLKARRTGDEEAKALADKVCEKLYQGQESK